MVDETLSLHGRSDETRWAACIHSKAQGDFVCLGLLDVNARTIEVRRDGATCMYVKAQGDFVCLGLLDVKAQAIR